jgi:hypothetical protein
MESFHRQPSWFEVEFKGIDFSDERLNHRLLSIAESLSEYPLSPINQACQSTSCAKAAYRFFANPKTLGEKILACHQEQTCIRAKNEERLFLIQDTCFVDYTSHLKTEGLGKLSNYREKQNKGKGLAMHTNFVLNQQGLPLGVVDQKIWSRPLEQRRNRKKRIFSTPIEKKESYRWLESLRKSVSLLQKQGIDPSRGVHIADREADIFEFMEAILSLKAHFVIRGNHQDRTIVREGFRVRPREGVAFFNIQDELLTAKNQADFWIEVPKRVSHTNSIGTPTRIAEVQIKWCSVRLAPGKRLMQRRRAELGITDKKSNQQTIDASLEVNVIWVIEKNPPPEAEPLEWFIYTDLPVQSANEAIDVIEIYKLRWKIELFHKVLKSGCRIEDCRLGYAERLKKYITLSSIVAWRILWMTHVNRTNPQELCTGLLTEAEWKSLYCRIQKTTILPSEPPTIHQAIHWIARLGGFLDRKSDGEPGMITIWRGWQRLADIAEDWKLFNSEKSYG